MARIKNILFMPILVFVLAAANLFAQSTVTGGIVGTVTDPQGGVVPNATVTLTSLGTDAVTTATTSSDGGYRFSNLTPGTYRLETTVTGFAPAKADTVVVEVSKITTVDIPLAVSGATAEVIVTGEAPVINTNDNSNSTNINQTSINELPINGRRASNFVLLTPGVAPDGNFGLISFRGISGLLNNSTIDGGDNNQAFFSEERGRTRISYAISQDAVREFSVNSSNYSAEFGRSAGGVVNTVTKSGTNDFHGSIFYYLRDNKWGARNPFSFQGVLTPSGSTTIIGLKPEDRRHQFGGSVGGRIIRDRLFFFFSYDQQKRDFPGVSAPASPSFLNPITVVAPSGNRVCSSPGTGQVVTTVAGEVLFCRGVTQAQTNEGLTYLRGLTGEVPRTGDQTLYLPKIDWVINDKHTLSGVYNRLRWDSPAGVQTQAVVTRGRTSFGSDLVSIDTFNLRLNSNLTPSTLNEVRFQYSRDLEQQLGQAPDPTEPTTANGFPPSVAIATNSGGITIGKPNFLDRAAYPDEKRWQFADTVTLIRGNHNIKFGGDFNHVSDLLDNLFQNAGAYSYNTLADFLTDRAIPSQKRYSSFNQGFGPSAFEFSTNDYNFFAQDDVRWTPELTLNFGLRYEYQQLASPQIPNPLEPRTANFPADKNNFGPRIGFAWAIDGKSNTVLRGGWGMYFGRIINSTLSNAITNTGVLAGQRQFQFQPSTAGSPLFPNVVATPPATGAAPDIIVFPSEIDAPMIHQADLILEREIARNLVVSVSGIMSIGNNLPTFVDTNLNRSNVIRRISFADGPYAGTFLDLPIYTGPRPNTNFGRITEIRNSLRSEYYALVLQANRRFTDGLQFQTSFTLSKSLDNGQGSQTFTSPNVPLDPYNYAYESGRSNFDVPHRFVASLVYNPRTLFGFGSESGTGRAIFGGWTLAPIVTYQSGVTYSAGVTGNISGGTSTGILGAGGANRLPSVERNIYRSPRLFNIDLRVSRRFRLSETMNIEILGETFNMLNHTNVTELGTTQYVVTNNPGGAPQTLNLARNTSGVPTFGVPTAAGNSIFRERQVQLAARFQF